MEPDAAELRVLGCLIEKQRTTPDQYPLTLNSLRLACNQSTNRDPVVSYDEPEVRAALDRLVGRRWASLATWSSARAKKYKHTFGEALGLSEAEMAALAVLMLRGPQTPGELGQRTERLHRFSAGEIEGVLEALAGRDLVASQPRRPGQREQRYEHLLAGEAAQAEPEPAPRESSAGAERLEDRVARVEQELLGLRDEVRALRAELGA